MKKLDFHRHDALLLTLIADLRDKLDDETRARNALEAKLEQFMEDLREGPHSASARYLGIQH